MLSKLYSHTAECDTAVFEAALRPDFVSDISQLELMHSARSISARYWRHPRLACEYFADFTAALMFYDD